MRIQPFNCSYFSTPFTHKKEIKQNPSFSKLLYEDSFEKDLDKSKDFTDDEKSLAKQLVDLTKDDLNKSDYNDFVSRYILMRANKRDDDPRAHKDRIVFSIENDRGLIEAMFIDPCIRYEDGTKLDKASLLGLAKDLTEWHNNQCNAVKVAKFMDKGAPEPYDDGDPMNGWVDPFPM